MNTNLGLDELDEKCLKQNNWEVAQNFTATFKKWADINKIVCQTLCPPWAPCCQDYMDNWMKYAWTEMTADLSLTLDAVEAVLRLWPFKVWGQSMLWPWTLTLRPQNP